MQLLRVLILGALAAPVIQAAESPETLAVGGLPSSKLTADGECLAGDDADEGNCHLGLVQQRALALGEDLSGNSPDGKLDSLRQDDTKGSSDLPERSLLNRRQMDVKGSSATDHSDSDVEKSLASKNNPPHSHSPPPQNCVWGNWNAYGACTLSCGQGQQTRSRSIAQNAAWGGAGCSGGYTESRLCNTQSCPVDCQWGAWSAWGVCSESCGEGSQSSTRVEAVPASNGGAVCVGDSSQSRSCNTQPCPVDCEFGPWDDWSACSQTCGGGEQSRSRVEDVPASNGGSECVGATDESQACNTEACPTPAPTPAPVCVDTPGWDNGRGPTCDKYVQFGYCANGGAAPGKAWTLGANYNYPEENCCSCGKPVDVCDPYCPAPEFCLKGVCMVCEDTPDWNNGYGQTCDRYGQWYCEDGAAKPSKGWTLGDTYNNPEQNCCACGKPAQPATAA